MMKVNNVSKVRNAVIRHTGKKVKIRINRGRHRIDEAEGTITETYPSVFVIKTHGSKSMPERVMAYSYTDVFTKDVELTLCS